MLSDYYANIIFDANISYINIYISFIIYEYFIYLFYNIYIDTKILETKEEFPVASKHYSCT